MCSAPAGVVLGVLDDQARVGTSVLLGPRHGCANTLISAPQAAGERSGRGDEDDVHRLSP